MASPAELYQDFAHIAAVSQQTLPSGYGLGPSQYHYTVTSWAVAAKPEDVWWEYFLVELDSSLFAGVAGTFQVLNYFLKLTLADESGASLPGAELVAASPDSTSGATSYTTSLNQTITSSVGMFGESPTASIGASRSVGHSVTRSIPDITVSNFSYRDGQDGFWNLQIALGTPAQYNNVGFTAQLLFRIPSPPPEVQVQAKLELTVRVEDHDTNGTAYWDRTMDAVRPGLQAQGATVTSFGSDRGGDVALAPDTFKLRRPQHPTAVIAPVAPAPTTDPVIAPAPTSDQPSLPGKGRGLGRAGAHPGGHR